jgi:hypothetical protein
VRSDDRLRSRVETRRGSRLAHKRHNINAMRGDWNNKETSERTSPEVEEEGREAPLKHRVGDIERAAARVENETLSSAAAADEHATGTPPAGCPQVASPSQTGGALDGRCASGREKRHHGRHC